MENTIRKSNKKQNIFLFVMIFTIVILVNYIGSFWFKRFDLTAEKRFTLTTYTINLLENLEDRVYIKVYLDGPELPIGFKKMNKAIREQLDEFKVYSRDNIEYEFINPTESSDKKIRYGIYKQLFDKGITPFESRQINEGKTTETMIFPAAIMGYSAIFKREGKPDTIINREIGINLLKNDVNYAPDSEENINNSIQSLEYEFANAIRKISQIQKPPIAFIEGHGELHELEVVDITQSLSEYYNVMRGRIGGKVGVLDMFEAIIIAKPSKPFDEADKFVLDQYIMQGGKVLWLIDGVAADMDSLKYNLSSLTTPLNLNLDDMLFKYGARINPVLVHDSKCALIGLAIGSDENPRIDLFPWTYFPVIITSNNHVINKYLNALKMDFASSVDTVGLSPEVKRTVILKSSNASKIEGCPARLSFDNLSKTVDLQNFKASELPVAILLEGTFESVFTNRPYKKFLTDVNDFKSNSKMSKMIIVGDGDIIRNDVATDGNPFPLGYDHIKKGVVYRGNKEFLLNAINYLCDDDGLMNIRNREMKLRLLDKDKVRNSSFLFQVLNVVVPIVLIIGFAIIIGIFRKSKYAGNGRNK